MDSSSEVGDSFRALLGSGLRACETWRLVPTPEVVMSVRERRDGALGFMRGRGFTVLGQLVVVLVILAADAPWSVRGLDADGNVLLDFKNGITSDPDANLQTWNTYDDTACNWSGVVCEAVPETRVVEINLFSYALGGTISPRLGDLGHLRALNLGANRFTGQIPSDLFGRLLNLTRLDLSSNALTGDIPAGIGTAAPHLQLVDVSGNALTGLPDDIRSCHQLQRLVLSRNNFTTALPLGWGSDLPLLQRLDLSMNHFTGPIPADFGNLTSLKGTLNLSSNRLTGAIPESLANLGGVFLDVRNNNLSGAIPPDSYFQSLGEEAFSGNAALCGSPLTTDCAPSPSPSAAASPENHRRVIGVAVGCGALALLITFIALCFVERKRAVARKTLTVSRSDNGLRGILCSWRKAANEEGQDGGELVHLTGKLSFTREELLCASAYVLSKSGAGIVYKAVLDDGTVVAVRRLGVASGVHPRKEFDAEAKTIAQARHPNVLALHSYSWTADEKLLIYEYLSNGSLETVLHEGSKGGLPWEVRVRVARGVAQGLAHIHECNPRRQHVHGDVKPGNILLDAFLEPRVADFGLYRLLSLATEPESTRETPRLSMYQAPDARRPSQKSDVYSFGVVLLELLTGRSPFAQLAAGALDLVSWMRAALQEKRPLSEIFDPFLLQTAPDHHLTMIEALQVAVACMAVNPESRPKMKQVAEFFEAQARHL